MFFVATGIAIQSGWNRITSALVWSASGVLFEYYQFYFTTDRFFDWFDVASDVFGVIICALVTTEWVKQD